MNRKVGDETGSTVKAKTQFAKRFLRNQQRIQTRQAQRECLKSKIKEYKRACSVLGKRRGELLKDELQIKKLQRTLNVVEFNFEELFKVSLIERNKCLTCHYVHFGPNFTKRICA